MALKLPPAPIQDGSFTANWRVWLVKVKESLAGTATLAWSTLDFTNSKLTDIVSRNHNDLNSKQGGTTNEYYHLTNSQLSGLTGGGDTALHSHAASSIFYSGTANLDFSSISSNSSANMTITVTGAAVGKGVILGVPAAIEAGLNWYGWVSATNTVTVRLHNSSGSSVDPAAADWTAWVLK